MTSPVYEVQVTRKGKPYQAHVQALPMLRGWAIGYLTPTGSHKKLTVKGNEHLLDTEAACIDRLNQIAHFRGWKRIEP